MNYCISSGDMFLIDSGETFTSNASILRYLARAAPALGLYGNSIMDRTEVLHCDKNHNQMHLLLSGINPRDKSH